MSVISHKAEKELQKRLHFERAISELSAKFVRLESHEVDREIEKGLMLIVNALDVDRCSLAQFSGESGALPLTHTYSIPGVRLLPSSSLEKAIPWYVSRIKRGEIVSVSNVDSLPKEAAYDKKWLKKQNTKSNLVIPLKVGNTTLGIMGLATTVKKRVWDEDLIQRLQLAGEVFANALMRKHSEQALHLAFEHIKKLKDQLEAENVYLKDRIDTVYGFKEIIGQSSAIRFVLNQVEKVASTDSTVLIVGDTGTGKELLANAIHRLSDRSQKTMVKINCASIPATLIENELFGREKGAYTGAYKQQIGRFEMADGSSLFLDEISELPLELQAKLLRILQEKKFERIGGTKTISVDVRIIAATNQNLLEAVQKGNFRQDLFYRLNVFPIRVPTLSQRREDIPLLVDAFVKEFGEAMAKRFTSVSSKSMNAMMRYSWPGNIRELRNVIERAMIMSSGRTLHIQLPKHDMVENKRLLLLDDVIRNHITEILNITGWKVGGKNGAAKVMGLPPSTLQSKMKKLGITRNKKAFDIGQRHHLYSGISSSIS